MEYNFNKYRYLGAVAPDVPKTWEPYIYSLIVQIDRISKPKYIPRWVLNIMGNAIRETILPEPYITQIKQKFGTLRVYGVFSEEVQKLITVTETLCNNTCEFCGAPNTTHVMVKSWVRNLCAPCKENKKYGSNN